MSFNEIKSLFLIALTSLIFFSIQATAQTCGVEISQFNKARTNVSKLENKIVKNERGSERFEKNKVKLAATLAALETKIADNAKTLAECQAATKCNKLRSLLNKKTTFGRKKATLDKKISRNTQRLTIATSDLPKLKTSLAEEKVKLQNATTAKDACLNKRVTPTPTPSTVSALTVKYSFEDNAVNTKYPIGQGLSVKSDPGTAQPVTSNAVKIAAFFYLAGGNSSANPSTFLEIVKDPRSQQNNLGLSPSNVTAVFDLPKDRCATEVSFDFLDQGGEVNLMVSGGIYRAQDFSNLEKTVSIDSNHSVVVTKKAQGNYQEEGTLKMVSKNNKCITSIGIGGQELFVDNLTVKSSSAA